MKRAAVYCRLSTTDQRIESHSYQLENEFSLEHGVCLLSATRCEVG